MSSQFFDTKTHILPAQYIREYPGATLDDQEEPLHLHIKQYIPKDQQDLLCSPVTIIGGHANAFPKVSQLTCYESIKPTPDKNRNSMNPCGMNYISRVRKAGLLFEVSGLQMLLIRV